MYEIIGLKDSFMEMIALMLIYLNTYLIDYEPLSVFEFIITFSVFILVYRFLFWGILLRFKAFTIESSKS